jgi:hypothetical protein
MSNGKDERTELHQLQRIEPYLRARSDRLWETDKRMDMTARMYQHVAGRIDGYAFLGVEGFRD